VNEPDRAGTWPANTWPAGINGEELPEHLWAPGGLMMDEEPPGPDPTGTLISLRFIGGVLRRGAWIWCLTAILGLLIGSMLYVKYPPSYHAQISVLLVDDTNQDPAVEVLTDQSLATSEPVAGRVVQELGLQQSIASLQAAYSVTVITDTVLQFDVGGPSSAAAVQRATALASSFLDYRAKYAQSQNQELVAELNQQYATAQQNLANIDTQISQLPTTNLTPAQKTQLDNLQTQQADQKQTMQYVTGSIAQARASTDAMISGSYVLDPATPVAHSKVKSAALYVAGGLFAGLALGMAILIVGALLSDRLRRRDDIGEALGAPVRLSVGRLRRQRLPEVPRLAAKRKRDMRRVIAYLQRAVPGSSRGPASLAVVAVDDAQTVASAVASMARSRAKEGSQVVVADLSSGAPLARLLGARDAGVHPVTWDGVQLVVAVPERDDVALVGPVRGGRSPALWAGPDEAVANACSSADLLLTLATLDPALGADHLATWASDAVAVVTAGRSSAEKVHSVGEMIRLAGIRLDSAVLLGADSSDESLGVMDQARVFAGGPGGSGEPERGGGSPDGGSDRGDYLN
jgi:capsular polysaccharide biosynthesis protein